MTKKSKSSSRREIIGKAKQTATVSASYLLRKTEKVLLVGFFAGLIYGKCALELIKDRSEDTT